MPLQTHQHFEAGRTALDFDRVKAFAVATDNDPHAIVAAVMIGSPQFAVRCMDNKLMSVLMIAVGRSDGQMGDRLARLEVVRLIAAFRRVFDDLEHDLDAREAQTAAWLAGRRTDSDWEE